MAEQGPGDQLAELAKHRGFKLVKSRRRKIGVGDYGKFGLTDAAGKALLGIGKDGLTASAQDIENYLRGGATSSWKQSAKIARSRGAKAPPAPGDGRPETTARAGRRSSSSRPVDERETAGPGKQISTSRRRSSPAVEAVVPPSPARKIDLILRAATSTDRNDLSSFLGAAFDHSEPLSDDLARSFKRGGAIVARLDSIAGCCFWTTIATPHQGIVGRITFIFVAEPHRRRGIGVKLFDMARQALEKQDCRTVEVMSDIEIRNFHGFFRDLGFEQKSYRFVRGV